LIIERETKTAQEVNTIPEPRNQSKPKTKGKAKSRKVIPEKPTASALDNLLKTEPKFIPEKAQEFTLDDVLGHRTVSKPRGRKRAALTKLHSNSPPPVRCVQLQKPGMPKRSQSAVELRRSEFESTVVQNLNENDRLTVKKLSNGRRVAKAHGGKRSSGQPATLSSAKLPHLAIPDADSRRSARHANLNRKSRPSSVILYPADLPQSTIVIRGQPGPNFVESTRIPEIARRIRLAQAQEANGDAEDAHHLAESQTIPQFAPFEPSGQPRNSVTARLRNHEIACTNEKVDLLRWRGVPRRIPKMVVQDVRFQPRLPSSPVHKERIPTTYNGPDLFLFTSYQTLEEVPTIPVRPARKLVTSEDED
jgi:hypothetical protein